MDWQPLVLMLGLWISMTLSQNIARAPIVKALPWVGTPRVALHPESGLNIHVLRNNQLYEQKDWSQSKGQLDSLTGEEGDEIQIGCKSNNVKRQEGELIKLTVKPLRPVSLTHNLGPRIWVRRKAPASCTWEGDKEKERYEAQCEVKIILEHPIAVTCVWSSKYGAASDMFLIKLTERSNATVSNKKTAKTPLPSCNRAYNLTQVGPQVVRQSNGLKIEDKYTLYHDVPHLQIGMNIDLLKAMLIHPDIEQLVHEVNRTTQRMLWQVTHDSKGIQQVLTKIEQVGKRPGWDIFTGYSPATTQVLHYLKYPLIVMVVMILLLSFFNVWLYYKLNDIVKKIRVLWTMIQRRDNLPLELDE